MSSHRHITHVMVLRIIIGLIWIAGALFNMIWTLQNPSDLSDSLGTNSTFKIYRWFFGDVVAAAPLFWITFLIIFELGLGLMILSRDIWARAGLLGSIAFSVFLFLIIWPYTLMMSGFALLSGWLLRYAHNMSVVDLLRQSALEDQRKRSES